MVASEATASLFGEGAATDTFSVRGTMELTSSLIVQSNQTISQEHEEILP